MLAFSRFRKAAEVSCVFCRNQKPPTYLRRFSLPSEEPPISDPHLPLRLCISVALKLGTFSTLKYRGLVSEVICTNNWFSLYWEGLEHIKKSGVFISSDSVYVLIRAYWQVGLAEKAIESFGRMGEVGSVPDAHAYNIILDIAFKKELFVLALAVYNLMLKSNCCPSERIYNMLIGGFCRSEDVNGALAMLHEMGQRDVEPSEMTYFAIVFGLCRARRVHEAHRTFNVMKERGYRLNSMSYCVLINEYCKMGRSDEAVSILQLLEKDGLPLDIKGYSHLIAGFFRERRYNEAHSWYGRMLKKGVVPDVVLYTVMIRGLSSEGRIGEAVKMFCEMTQQGLVPDAVCYNEVIKGFCDAGLLDRARSLQLQISEHEGFHNVCTHTILICDLCKRGMVDEAQEIFNRMEKSGCFPSLVTFNTLIYGLCKAGKLEEAHLMWYKMEMGRSPSLFFRLSRGSNQVLDRVSLRKKVEQMCETGQLLDAYKFLIQLADSGVMSDIVTYNVLLYGFCRASKLNGALKLFKDMQDKGPSPDSVTYGTLIDGLFRVGREEDALKMYEHMLKHGCQPSFEVYKALMTWLSRNKKVSQAISYYLSFLKNLRGREGDSINVLEGYFVRGEVEQAIRGLLELDFRFRDFNLAPYTILLIGFCQANQLDEALIIFSVLDKFNININPPSCVYLIEGLCRKGRLDDAVNIFLYALEKGFVMRSRICERLLKCLLCSPDKRGYAIDLVRWMESAGYHLNKFGCSLHISIKEKDYESGDSMFFLMSQSSSSLVASGLGNFMVHLCITCYGIEGRIRVGGLWDHFLSDWWTCKCSCCWRNFFFSDILRACHHLLISVNLGMEEGKKTAIVHMGVLLVISHILYTGRQSSIPIRAATKHAQMSNMF
ncbi:hypothetical protein ACSQ67_019215 [Phaseolus vulgaris]